MRDRYRRGWAADRYSRCSWYLAAALFLLYILGGIWLALSDVDIFLRLFGGMLAAASLVPAIVALRQAPRSDKA